MYRSRGLRFDLPTIIEDDEEELDSIIPTNGVAISSDTLADRGNTRYQGHRFVFTINNPPEVSKDWGTLPEFGGWFMNKYGARFVYWSYEKGAGGTKHIQGYFELKQKVKAKTMSNKFRGLALAGWVAPAKGTAEHSIDYIGHMGDEWADKPGLLAGPWSVGRVMVQGQRTDLTNLADAIRAGMPMRDLCMNYTATMLRVYGNAQRMVNILDQRERNWTTECYVYTGVAGSGKSHAAHAEAREYIADLVRNQIIKYERPYDLMVPGKNQPLWWQGYTGQSVVIIDDFYGTIAIDEFKRLIDKWPVTVNVKNGDAQFLARRVYITSNIGWKNWWGNDLLKNKNDEWAIQRRITVNKTFDEVYVPPLVTDAIERGPVTMLNDLTIDDHMPVRSNAMLVGNALQELWCDEEADVFPAPHLADAPKSPLSIAYGDPDENGLYSTSWFNSNEI